jgi:hypothetical protein
MRDIRDDLRERVKAMDEIIARQQADYEKERDEAEKAFKIKIERLRHALMNYKRMLDLEESIAKMQTKADDGGGEAKFPKPKLALADYLCATLADRGAMSKDDLLSTARGAGYYAEGEGGRALHATMVNLVRGNRVIVNDRGLYEVAKVTENALL